MIAFGLINGKLLFTTYHLRNRKIKIKYHKHQQIKTTFIETEEEEEGKTVRKIDS